MNFENEDAMIDPTEIRKSFPIFANNPDLIYFDNAATTQKPDIVVDGICDFYKNDYSNIHRGIYDLAAITTQKYEAVRDKVATFIGAPSRENIVYTSGTTAGINLVAFAFLAPRLQAGDEVLITAMEHHANLIPWQIVCQSKGATLKTIPVNEDGSLRRDSFRSLLNNKTKMLAIVHISNATGYINPIKDMINLAHEFKVPVLVDGAQSVAHYEIDVNALDVDFFVFSGHKVFGPTGIGILYGKSEHLSRMEPLNYGGSIIKDVRFEKTTFLEPPHRFEAGTTNIAGVIGLGYAIDFINQFDKLKIQQYLKYLRNYCISNMQEIKGLRILGSIDDKNENGAIISFLLDKVHPHDVATILGVEKIAVRAGNHCTQPLMDFLELPGTSRASFSIYNTPYEVDQFVRALESIQQFFK